jgi:hypothetical protein
VKDQQYLSSRKRDLKELNSSNNRTRVLILWCFPKLNCYYCFHLWAESSSFSLKYPCYLQVNFWAYPGWCASNAHTHGKYEYFPRGPEFLGNVPSQTPRYLGRYAHHSGYSNDSYFQGGVSEPFACINLLCMIFGSLIPSLKISVSNVKLSLPHFFLPGSC